MADFSDRVLGQIAVRLGYASAKQVEDALRAQESLPLAPPLGVLMAQRGMLTEAQIEHSLRRQAELLGQVPTQDGLLVEGKAFGQIAVCSGLVGAEAVNEALKLWARRAAEGRLQRLGEILCELGALGPDGVVRILEIQAGAAASVASAPHAPGPAVSEARPAAPTEPPPAFPSTVLLAGNAPPRTDLGPIAPPRSAPESVGASPGLAPTPRPPEHTLQPLFAEGAVREAPATPAPPRRLAKLGKYELVQELGRGGMGVVYKAYHTELEAYFALKVVLHGRAEDTDSMKRFRREARAAARLRHPGIATVFDIGEEEGKTYFVMEYVEGKSLAKVLADPAATGLSSPPVPTPLAEGGSMPSRCAPRQRCALPALVAARLTREIAEALQAAHDAGVLHRDLKPSNVMFDRAGRTKLVDFGLAKIVDAPGSLRTPDGAILGTPAYMSPEQAQGRVGELGVRSDVYQLGALFYELLTGRPPHEGTSALHILTRVVAAEPPRPRVLVPALPQAAESICLKCLEKDPVRRYATAAEVAADLGRFLDSRPVHAPAVSNSKRLWRKAVRARRVVAPSLAALLLAGGLGIYLMRGGRDSAESEARVAPLLESARGSLDRAAQRLWYTKDARPEDHVPAIDGVEQLLRQAIEKSPRSAAAHYLLGRAFQLRGDQDQADECWRRAVELDPAFGPAHVERGRALLVRRLAAGLASAEGGAGGLHAETDRLAAEAGRELLAALGGAGMEDPLRRQVALALQAWSQNELPVLSKVATEGAARFGREAGAEDLHWLFALSREGDERRRALDVAIELRPRHAEALLCRGLAQRAAGDLQGAKRDWQATLDAAPRGWAARRVTEDLLAGAGAGAAGGK
ncbi:MAG: protein kinase [Planctomycetes bacterium]|nr:protein kinase [Planctomycetota bacterium]